MRTTYRLIAFAIFCIVLVACGVNEIAPTETFLPTIAPPTATAIPTFTPLLPTFTPTPGIGSTMVSKDGMTMIYIPAGDFIMGGTEALLDRLLAMNSRFDFIVMNARSNDISNTEPEHVVYLDAYWIDQTEVTIAQYKMCVETGKCREVAPQAGRNYDMYMPRYNDPIYANYPVAYVNWEMASEYCSWAGRRLPTEAEWEKAARGTEGNMFPWGNELPTFEHLNSPPLGCEDNPFTALGFTAPSCESRLPPMEVVEVGQYPKGASPFGVLDMGYNVSEWVADWYSTTYYASSPNSNPRGPESGSMRVSRGAAFNSQFGNGELFITLRGGQETQTGLSSKFVPFEYWEARGFRCASNP